MKVTYQPIQTLVIHNITKLTLTSFIKLMRNHAIANQRIPALEWCNGIVFEYDTFPPGDEINKDELEGKRHWRSVRFAEMPQFQEKIPLDAGGNLLITDQSEYCLFSEAIKFIKEMEPHVGRRISIPSNGKESTIFVADLTGDGR